MASGPVVGGDDGAKEKKRYSEHKVYTRKAFRGQKKGPNFGKTVAPAPVTPKNDEAATTTATPDDINSNSISAVQNRNTSEANSNSNNVLAQPPALPAAATVSEGGNSSAPQASLISEGENFPQPQPEVQNSPQLPTEDQFSAQPLPGDRNSPQQQPEDQKSPQPQPEDQKSPQPQTEDQNSHQPQAEDQNSGDRDSPQLQTEERNSPQLQTEDQNSPQLQTEDRNSPQPQVSSRLEDGNTAQLQVNSKSQDQNSPQPQVSSRLEDGNSPQLQGNSKSQDGNSPHPLVNSRLEGGNSSPPAVNSELEGRNSPHAQSNSRLGDGNSEVEGKNSPQPQANSRLEDSGLPQPQANSEFEGRNSPQPQANSRLGDGNSPQPQVNLKVNDGNSVQPSAVLVTDDLCSHQQKDDGPSNLSCRQEAVPMIQEVPSWNGAVEPQLEDRVKISLGSKSKQEMQELRWKLEKELDIVRSLVKRIEVKQRQNNRYSSLNVIVGDGIANGGGTKRARSEVASAGIPREISRPLHQLSLSMLENSHGVSENVEKEKRTPKANQFYHNSEFLLAKDKFPPAESNKKSKLNSKKHGGGEMGHGLGMGSKFFKNCSSLLEKLMKHKHGWVFNAPVDVEGLGLHDYYTIITHPMDLGTVKSRLNKNWYRSPKEFAEDVRLTFLNAMTYNPKGQDVHVMAEQLSKIFEDRWAIIESDFNREMRYVVDYGAGQPAPSPLSRKVTSFTPPPLDMRRILNRSQSMIQTPRPMSITPSSRTPAPKKPKAKDPNKRDMTFEEKQKLSTNLQSLPSEKLDAIVQIIKKKNLALNQHDDEIEVDIDSVDAETLWELDRFVTNYKKSLSKHKRKAEVAAQKRAETLQKSRAAAVVEIPKETRADERNVPQSLPVQGGNQADNGSRSSSSSSSSSDSGSSSSDSDSDSSSASGSDAGSQGT